MTVGPSGRPNTALMVLSTDRQVPDETFERLQAADGILDLHRVTSVSALTVTSGTSSSCMIGGQVSALPVKPPLCAPGGALPSASDRRRDRA